ncbi:uncharacterized protein [Argopecten irradians]|uniref:uncharacterized protein n=1 Tax=Argopecten irradians TaxID=31199 RepID=UPI00371B021D
MATGGKRKNGFKLSKTVMEQNWGLLKEIRVADIIDSMIEKSLIKIPESLSIQQEQISEPMKAEKILYRVFQGPQSHRDSFLKILETKGYNYIVKILKGEKADGSSRTSGKSKETLESEAITKQFSEMKADLKQQQQQQHMELMERTENILKAVEELKQSDEQRKENEKKIKQLESELLVLQDELRKERLKRVQSQERIKELEKEIKTVNDKLDWTKQKVSDVLSTGDKSSRDISSGASGVQT